MLRVKADPGRCEGYTNCLIAAPEVFDLDDDGIVAVLTETVDETRRAEVEEAIRNCPTAAIWFEHE